VDAGVRDAYACGAKVGKIYRTRVNVFRRPGGFLVALYSKPDSGGKKVLAAVGGQHETRLDFTKFPTTAKVSLASLKSDENRNEAFAALQRSQCLANHGSKHFGSVCALHRVAWR
jgi:hypothetical protein